MGFERRASGAASLLPVVQERGTSLDGVVLDAKGAPAEGAKVTCRVQGILPPDPLDVTDTDEAGRFSFQGLPADWLAFTVLCDGHGARKVVRKLAEGERAFLPVTLPPAACCEGRVVDDRGEPVAEAMLRVLDRTQGLELGHVATAADGAFSLCCVPAGDLLQIEVWKQGHLFVTQPDLEAPAANVRIVLPRLGAVRGRVVDEAGRPVPGCSLRWMPVAVDLEEEALRWRWFDPVAVDPRDGSFQLGDVWPGEVELTLVAPGLQPLSRTVHVAPGEAAETGETVLAPGRVVEGRVLDSALEPVAGAVVAAAFLTGDGRLVAEAPAQREITGSDGSFRLAGVPGTPFALGVSPTAGRWQWFADSRAEDFPRDLVLRASGSIRGHVEVPWSSAESAVVLRAVEAESFLPVEVHPARGGSFRIDDLGARRYQLECADLWRAAEQGVLTRRVVPVDVEAADEQCADLFELDPVERRISGRVLRGGAPVRRAALVVRSDDRVEARCTSDEAGRFEFAGLPDGVHDLELVALERGTVVALAQSFEVRAAQAPQELVVELPEKRALLRVRPAVGVPGDAVARLVDPATGRAFAWSRARPDGTFTLRTDLVVPQIEVSAPGCAVWRGEVRAGPIDVALAPEARLRVCVRGEDGAPLAEARVAVECALLGWLPARHTDARGLTEFPRLPEGDVHVRVSPCALPSAGLKGVHLAAGECREVEFQVAPE